MLKKCHILLHPVILNTQMKSYASFQNSIPMRMISKSHQKISGSLTAYEDGSRVKACDFM
jgi:hypothetical protein